MTTAVTHVEICAEGPATHAEFYGRENDGEARVAQYEEARASEPDNRRLIRSVHFMSHLAVMESSREAPELLFDCVATTRGLDDVAGVRGTKETAEAGASLEAWPQPLARSGS